MSPAAPSPDLSGGPDLPAALVSAATLSGRRSQAVFDVLLRALAEPGTLRRLPDELCGSTVPAVCVPALALADIDVPVAVVGRDAAQRTALVAAATGAPCQEIGAAWLVVIDAATAADAVDALAAVAVGDALHPEAGARVALAVAAVTIPGSNGSNGSNAAGAAGSLIELTIEGPGVDGRRSIAVSGLAPAAAGMLGRASGTFPAGFDTWLVTPGGDVVGLPRSTSITIGKG